MTVRVVAAVGSVALAVLAGWAVPAVTVRMLLPTLEAGGPKVTNYRGARIPTGLGVAWPMAAITFALIAQALELKVDLVAGGLQEVMRGISAIFAGALVPSGLVAGVFAFGMIDDVFGGADAKGFGGHLAALRRGQLTTGALKMLGIGALALVSGGFIAISATESAASGTAIAVMLAVWVLTALIIALSANLVNLTDLRPGRALKVYTFGAIPATIAAAVTHFRYLAEWTPLGASPGIVELLAVVASVALFVAGPALAVWRYDLGERAMLGDAGANAAGAFAGYLLASALPLWGLAIAAAVLLALNLASERVSFTKVIEANAFLRWLDGLGRVQHQVGEKASGPVSDVPDDDRDGSASNTGRDG